MLASTTKLQHKSSRLKVINYAKGGIGNQLFQHVFALSLAKKLDADLMTDISFFGADPYGNQARIWNLIPGAKTARANQFAGEGCYLLQDGLISSIQDTINLPANCKALILSGYWQQETLLDPEVVREIYILLAAHAITLVSPAIVENLQSNPNSVAIHLRRRDYAHMGLCKDSYYLAAIDHIILNYPDAELFVFSDEPNYAQHLLRSKGLQFAQISSGSDLGDLYLMSLCKHFIIANSSYSWWAAFFGEAKGGLICCPKEWVTIDSTPSPCPPRWLQMAESVRPFNLNEAEIAHFGTNLQRLRFDNAIRAWFAGRGDQTLRVEFGELRANSVVFDLGGYSGDWTAEITMRYSPYIYVFEPVRTFFDQICSRFIGLDKIKPFQYGLGARDENLELHLSADGSGAFAMSSAIEIVQIKEVGKVFENLAISNIDLMKVNIEGGEFELLEHLIETGEILKIKRLQIQFHDFVPNAIERRANILRQLSKTHRQKWCFYFVWEEWELVCESKIINEATNGI